MLTFPDTETDTKWAVQNCVEMFMLHRDRHQQILIGFCANLSVSVSVSRRIYTIRTGTGLRLVHGAELALSWTSVNISACYYTFHLLPVPVPVSFPYTVNIPLVSVSVSVSDSVNLPLYKHFGFTNKLTTCLTFIFIFAGKSC